MKKLLLLLCIQTLFTQAQVTQPAGNGVTSPSNACMACAGSGWNNEMNITALDGSGADVSLMQNGFCFQSTCFASRYLEATQFGFSIPGTATVVGIEVNITRKATDTSAIKDSIVQLITNAAPAGVVKKATAFWDTSYTTTTYGSPTDLWGSTSAFWTPTAINATTTGVHLKILNQLATASNSVYVDYVSMTVYFTNTTGIIESQTSVPAKFYVSEQENNLSFSFYADGNAQSEIKLFDVSGKLVFCSGKETLPQGRHEESFNTNGLAPGIYIANYTQGTKQVYKKIILTGK